MWLDFLKERFREKAAADAVIWRDRAVSYSWILKRFEHWLVELDRHNIHAGTVAVLDAEYSPDSIALLLAMIERALVLVPLTPSAGPKKAEYVQLAETEAILRLSTADSVEVVMTGAVARHPLYATLRERKHPGLVLFSSGTSGTSKGTVHDFTGLLAKFHTRRRDLRTLTFMQFDHIGGLDTLLYSLSNGSCIITVEDRSPQSVCRAIALHKVEVLPVTPTFLNLLLLSEAYEGHDLSSLKFITYGTEVMPQSTLDRVAQLFPNVTLLQKYGTTEIGTLRSKSKAPDSLWVKIGGEGFETRIVDGLLEVKARSAMLGYLNAPSPFTDDGWYKTGDAVEQDGEFIRFLGRVSEIINVGGEKVYPAEVENVIQQMPEVAEVTIYGEKNPITGQIVVATVTPAESMDHKDLVRRIKVFARERLEPFKVPVKITIVDRAQHSERFKKARLAR